MENIIAGMKEKADFPEKVRDNTRSKIVEEDGFIVEIDANTEASKRGESFENLAKLWSPQKPNCYGWRNKTNRGRNWEKIGAY